MATNQPTRRVQLIEAQMGDENGRRVITKSLQERLNEDKDVPVNSALIPWFDNEPKMSLARDEQEKARKQAVDACFGAHNQACVLREEQRIKESMLDAKKKQVDSTANVVKGRRLVIKILDRGQKREITIPEGQVLSPKMMGVTFAPNTTAEGPPRDPSWTDSLPSVWGVLKSILMYGGVFLASFLYIVSILTTWQSFRNAGYSMILSGIPTAIAVFLPYSGFFITGGFFLILRFYLNKKNTLPKT